MEIDGASSEQPDNDPLALEEGEDVPTTFPGHEQLLPVNIFLLFNYILYKYK